ncbi:MAG: ATP-binding cassette domain-containing protein [Pseudomonadota bacterium]
MKAIEATNLCKSYREVVALQDVSFSVEKGEIIGLLGPNGAGKTTLMKVLTGYLQPDAGSAIVCGVDVIGDPLGVQQRIGYLPENAPLYAEMTVQDYLRMMASLRSVPDEKQSGLLSEAIYASGLEKHLLRPIGKLSKGYRQRVGVAQAILHRPELLILDEPTSGLDPTQIAEIRTLIRRLSAHSTVVLSTHILSEVEMTCERVLILIGGRLQADSRLDALRKSAAAVVSIEGSERVVQAVLSEIDGIERVERLDAEGGYTRWRVSSMVSRNLCPEIYDTVRREGWRLGELRPETRTLESVFRQLAASPELTNRAATTAAAEAASVASGREAMFL